MKPGDLFVNQHQYNIEGKFVILKVVACAFHGYVLFKSTKLAISYILTHEQCLLHLIPYSECPEWPPKIQQNVLDFI